MIPRNLFAKFSLIVGSIILLVTVILVTIITDRNNQAIHERANREVNDRLDAAERMLRITDSIMLERVRSAMALLQQRGNALGQASLGEPTRLGERMVPNLLLGDQPQVRQYELVDSLTDIAGGTATLFVKHNDEFVRVSTNVMKNGERAIGTILNPDGKAIKAIRQGQAYFGEVDILGTPYLTGYAPITNSAGRTIGIWYVGYKADLAALEQAITSSRILENGVVALLDNRDRLRMHSDNITVEQAEQLVAGKSPNWTLQRKVFEPWGYSLVAAYPESEISAMIRNQATWILLAGVLFCVLLAGIISWLFRSMINRPLNQAVQLAEAIAGGDLSRPVGKTSRDEIGQLLAALDHMQQSLRQFMKGVADASGQVTESSTELTRLTTETVKAVDDQRSRTDEVATAMTEMSATVSEVANNAAETAAAAQRADEEARQGLAQVEAANSTYRELSEKIGHAGESMQRLAQDSAQIGAILDVIGDIAEQTNLLALNAAIEAARAGEQGGGFAVVADEVRTLAQRAQSSTDEIHAMIERLQTAAEEAGQHVSAGEEAVQQSVAQSARVGESLHAIASAIETLNNMNTQIASAAEEQSTVAGDVDRNVVRITEMADQTGSNAHATAAAADQLDSLSSELRDMLTRYRL